MDSVFENFDKDMQSLDNEEFMLYLCSDVLDAVSVDALYMLLEKSDVYVFSGVIRDYFLRRGSQHRDLDLVLEHNVDWRDIYKKCAGHISVKTNSYGGLKVHTGSLTIDIWTMGHTWGLMRKGIRLTPQNLVRTAFFNFSAIVYSIRRRRFYVHHSFAEFLNNREIGVQYKDNPNVPLCILNALHYKDLLKMPLTAELKRWVSVHYSIFDDYETPQLSHWGAVKYDNRDIRLFVSQCELGI